MEQTEAAIEIPPLFDESFKHVMFPLIERYEGWDNLLAALEQRYTTLLEASNQACNLHNDAAKALHEAPSKNPVIKFLTRSDSSASESTLTARAKNKLAGWCKKKYEFGYLKNGGVSKNLKRMNDEVEQMALLHEKKRKYIATETIPKLLALKDGPVKARLTAMKEWKVKFDEMEVLKTRAIGAYENLVQAAEKYKVNTELFTPAPLDDPEYRRLEYQTLRDRYLHTSNTLQLAARVHLSECNDCEPTISETIHSVISDYNTVTKHHLESVHAIVSLDKTPFNEDDEWKHFLSQHPCVPALPLEPIQARNLRFYNENHFKTKPIAEANLILDTPFPWSIKSSGGPRKYLVTRGGYLVKEGAQGELPRPAFRLVDCFVIPQRAMGGRQCFQVTGVNCLGNPFWTWLFGREVWTFWGTEKEVGPLLAAMKSRMQVVRYPTPRYKY
jgi:hypothetical protein